MSCRLRVKANQVQISQPLRVVNNNNNNNEVIQKYAINTYGCTLGLVTNHKAIQVHHAVYIKVRRAWRVLIGMGRYLLCDIQA